MSDHAEVPFARPFVDFLREQRNGAAAEDLTEGLHELVQAVTAQHTKGTLTLTLTVAPLKDNAGVLTVVDSVVVKAPKAPKRASVFYPDAAGNLTRDDPNQPQLDGLKVVGTRPIRGEEGTA